MITLHLANVIGVRSQLALSGPARKNGLETLGILRLRFLHLLPNEELSHFGSANLNSEMHAAGPFGERRDAVALAERVGSLGLGSQGQKAILLTLGDAHRLLALVTCELAGLEVPGPQESGSG